MADKFQLKAIISAVDKITPTLKGVQRAARMTNKTLRDIGGAGRSLMGSLGLTAGLAFGSVIYGATRAASAALQYAGSIQDAADRTGAGTTEYQTLVAMLEQVGGSAEDAEMAFTQFNKGVSNAAAGADKNFAGLLHKLKIPMKDAQGNVRSLTDMMPELADAFARNTDPALRTRMAMELFGKSGTKLIPILAGGRKAYAAWAAEQERMGVIIGKDSIGALDDMGDSLGLLNKQVKSQLVQSIASLAPVIQPIIKSMSEWIAANKVLIQTNITKALTEIANALKDVDWVAFVGGIRDTIKGVGSFVETMGGLKNVLIGMGVLWLAGPVAALGSMVMAVGRATMALGLLLFRAKATSSGYAVMGVIPAINTALGASFVWLRTQALAAMLVLRMGGVSALATVAMQAIGAAVVGLGTAFMGAARAVLLVSRALLLSPLGIVLGLATAALLIYENWDTLKKWFGEFVGWIGKKFSWVADQAKSLIPDWMREMFGGSVSVTGTQEAMKAAAPVAKAAAPVAKAAAPVAKAAAPVAKAAAPVAKAAAPVAKAQSGTNSPAPEKTAQTSTSRAPTPLIRSGALAMAGGNFQLNGEMMVRFENAPAGMRVAPGKTNQPGVGFNPDVGYRSLSLVG